MAQKESKLSRRIMDALRAEGAFCFKVHGSEFMMAGLPDIVGCYQGRFFAFETKTPIGKGPSRIQVHVMGLIRRAGGTALVVRSIAEARQAMLAMVDESD